MIIFIILTALVIFTILQLKYDIVPICSDSGAVIYLFFISFCLFLYSIIILLNNHQYRKELNNYINYVEKYQKIKDSDKIKDIENAAITQEFSKWDNKIEDLKYKNNSGLDIFIPDKKLKEALKARKEITTKPYRKLVKDHE